VGLAFKIVGGGKKMAAPMRALADRHAQVTWLSAGSFFKPDAPCAVEDDFP